MPTYVLIGGKMPITCHGEDARIAAGYELTRLKLNNEVTRIELMHGPPLKTRYVWIRTHSGWMKAE